MANQIFNSSKKGNSFFSCITTGGAATPPDLPRKKAFCPIKKSLKILNFVAIADLKIKNEPNTLYDPINYLFSKKGKRIRSVLVLLSNQLFHDNLKGIKELVLGIESLHNFTLIHDDVMDNAVLRRGTATINQKWSINQAILSGDVLMIHAYKH